LFTFGVIHSLVLNCARFQNFQVVSVLSQKGRCERASIDEVYLDLTHAAETMLMETSPQSMQEFEEEVLKSHVLGLEIEVRGLAFSEIALLMLISRYKRQFFLFLFCLFCMFSVCLKRKCFIW